MEVSDTTRRRSSGPAEDVRDVGRCPQSQRAPALSGAATLAPLLATSQRLWRQEVEEVLVEDPTGGGQGHLVGVRLGLQVDEHGRQVSGLHVADLLLGGRLQ